jgi:hypothetical protein
MQIAMMEILELPANCGSGTVAKQTGSQLVQRGHYVTVYCRQQKDSLPGRSHYKGLRQITSPLSNTFDPDLMVYPLIELATVVCYQCVLGCHK